MNSSTQIPLTARQKERQKSDKEKLSDWSNLISHTIACFITDPPSLIANNWAKQHISFEKNGKGFSASVDFSSKTNLENEPSNVWEAFMHHLEPNNLLKWGLGEGIGDMTAIPLTIAVQRTAPEVMHGLEKTLEIVVGPYYKEAANKAADQWAHRHNVMIGSQEHYEHAQDYYRQNMRQLSQAFVWTAISMVAGAYAQKHLAPNIARTAHHNEMIHQNFPKLFQGWEQEESIPKLIAASIVGKLITLGAVNIPRLAFPDTIQHAEHELTEFIERKITSPTNKIIEHGTGLSGTIHTSDRDLTVR